MKHFLLVTLLIATATIISTLSAFTIASATHSNNIIGLLGIDANVQGNTATSLGQIDGCARVEPGAQIDVDYFVDAIPPDRPLVAFEVVVVYNAALLEITAVDYDLLLASVGSYQPFVDLTDPLPDSDGEYRLVVLDIASQTEMRDPNTNEVTQQEANVERGPGVLARLTFRAKAAGISEVDVGYDPQNGGPYPLTQDTLNETIIADKIGGASIAIGQDCPPEVIAPAIIDAPNTEAEIFGGTPPPGPPLVPVSGTGGAAPPTPTPEGQTPTPTPEGQTPGPGQDGDTELVPCQVSPLPTPPPTSPPPPPAETPEGQTPSPALEAQTELTVTASPVPTELPTPELCTPTPGPTEEDISEVDEDSNSGLLVGAIALLGLGTAAAGGGYYAFRRSRNGVA